MKGKRGNDWRRSNVKMYSVEILYKLCDANTYEFTMRDVAGLCHINYDDAKNRLQLLKRYRLIRKVVAGTYKRGGRYFVYQVTDWGKKYIRDHLDGLYPMKFGSRAMEGEM